MSEKVTEQIIPVATIVTPKLASKIKFDKYQENLNRIKLEEKMRKEKEVEKKLIIVDKLYKQTIKAIEKWMYDENDYRLEVAFFPIMWWCFIPFYCTENEAYYLKCVAKLVQENIGNTYKVDVGWQYIYEDKKFDPPRKYYISVKII